MFQRDVVKLFDVTGHTSSAVFVGFERSAMQSQVMVYMGVFMDMESKCFGMLGIV